MLLGFLLLSLPLVKGTTQNEHMLSHPLVIDTKAVTPFFINRVGLISAYVSSKERNTLIAFFPSFTCCNNNGRSLYASGPTTRSTNFSSSKKRFFNLSAMHPKTPTIIFLFFLFLIELKYSSLFLVVCSAFSLIEHVLIKTKSACSISFVFV